MKFLLIETQSILYQKHASKNLVFTNEQKNLIDTMVDPIHVISNSNEILQQKILPFVDAPTREYFYMIERAQNRLLDIIEKIKGADPKAF